VRLATRWLRRRESPAAEKPLRDELLSIERLDERAVALAASLTVDPNPRRRARDTFPRFEDNVRVLRGTYRSLAEDVRTGQFVTSAADWLLDNFHLITSEIVDIRRNLPRTYYRTLPALASREHEGHARIYAIAVELIRHSDSRLSLQQLIQFLNSYQRVAPLTIGELWAWPSMLKLALIENLRRLADEMLAARDARRAADHYVSRADEGRDLEALPLRSDTAFIVQLLHRVREYGIRLSAIRVVSNCSSRVPDAERERPLWQLAQYVSIVFDASWADIRAADQSASPATRRAIASVFCIDVVAVSSRQ